MKVFTTKVPQNLRQMDIEPFIKPSRYHSKVEMQRQILLLARDRLATIGNKRANATLLREEVYKEIPWAGKALIYKTLSTFLDELNKSTIPSVVTKKEEHNHPESRGERLETLLQQQQKTLNIIYNSQMDLLNNFQELAKALYEGGDKNTMAALSKIPWLRR